jgi:hypothetical protein
MRRATDLSIPHILWSAFGFSDVVKRPMLNLPETLCRIVDTDFREHPSVLKNPSTPLPTPVQGLKNPAIAVFFGLDV